MADPLARLRRFLRELKRRNVYKGMTAPPLVAFAVFRMGLGADVFALQAQTPLQGFNSLSVFSLVLLSQPRKDGPMFLATSRLSRHGTFSMLLVVVFFGPRACLEVEQTTTFERDGSGAVDLALRVDEKRLRAFTGDTATATPAQFKGETFGRLRAALDTVPGVRFDTAWARREGGIIFAQGRFLFDDPESFSSAKPDSEKGEGSIESKIHAEAGTVRVVHRRKGDGKEGAEAADPQAQKLNAAIMKGLIQQRFRYVFPDDVEVLTADPPVSRTDSSVVWRIAKSELLGEPGMDSAYVAIALP